MGRLDPPPATTLQHGARILLGASLVGAGLGHLTWARDEFQAQVPSWVPIDADLVVLASGVVEIGLGAALIALVRRRVVVGWVAAGFFVVIFPGNIAQFVEGNDGFGLESDTARGVRLLFQPVLVAWALWSTGAWAARRRRHR
ncbi:MAG: DoxX family protein [Acidimicrobiales bacterium]